MERTARTSLIALAMVFLLACVPAFADDTRRFRSREYDITTDLPDPIAREVADHMDAIAREYNQRFRAYGKRNAQALRLWVFDTREGYDAFLAGHGLDASGTGGMFFRTDSASGLASFLGDRPLESMLETLRHEGLHQVAYQRIGDTIPVWLNEGMAEWFSYALPTRRGFAVGLADPRAVRRLARACDEGALLPLADLLTMTKPEWNRRVNTGEAGSQYDQAWSVVHFLAHAERGRYQPLLDRLLRAYWMGKNDEQAVNEVFGPDLAPMEAAWHAFLDDLEPDELYRGLDALSAHRSLLIGLDALGVRPADEREFDEALAAHADRLEPGPFRALVPGTPAPTIGPDGWWRTPPTASKTGRPAIVRFVPDRRGQLPPGIEIRGLSHQLSLVWSRSRDGALHHELVID